METTRALERAARLEAMVEEIDGSAYIDWHTVQAGGGSAGFGRLRIPADQTRQDNYLTGLHEVGHLFHQHKRRSHREDYVMQQELEAWLFAFDHFDETEIVDPHRCVQSMEWYRRQTRMAIPREFYTRLAALSGSTYRSRLQLISVSVVNG